MKYMLIAMLFLFSSAAYAKDFGLGTRITPQVIGSADAKVTVHLISSLSCRYSAKAYRELVPQVESRFAAVGDVRLKLTEFPINQYAVFATMLLHCVPENQRRSLYTHLFKEIERAMPDAATATAARSWLAGQGRKFGLIGAQAEKCFDNTNLHDDILHDRELYRAGLGISRTPTFIIQGADGRIQKIEKVPTMEELDRAIRLAM